MQRSNPIEYIKVLRPDHWLKNIFIFFGHVVAVELLKLTPSMGLVWSALLSLVPACLIASANYILNEILDAPFDKVHPTKQHRPIPAGKVNVGILWGIMGLLIVLAFAISIPFFNAGYQVALLLLLLSGVVYNIPPVRMKDKAYWDVLAESFNNPIRLWLGWYALADTNTFPPLSVIMAWWAFGGLLMAGKRYAEFRFINDPQRSAEYRRSFSVYTERSLIISMITYANFFCFCMGVAITVYRPNLLFVFPVIVGAIIVYFRHAMSTEGARLEPEQLMRNPILIACTAGTVAVSLFLVWTKTDLTAVFHFLQPIGFPLGK